MEKIHCREALRGDIPELKKLFVNTVLNINIQDYTQEEVSDWASCGISIEHWNNLFDKFNFWVAEINSNIVGFVSISDNGYIHSLFTHKYHQNKGIATLLLSVAEAYAQRCRVETVTSDVSITALPLFQKKGYLIIERKLTKASTLNLQNYKVEKHF